MDLNRRLLEKEQIVTDRLPQEAETRALTAEKRVRELEKRERELERRRLPSNLLPGIRTVLSL